MKTFGYWLMAVGIVQALGGVVAVFNFDEPSDVFSPAWWMIVAGWGLALTGMGIDIMHLSRIAKRQPAYLSPPEMNGAKGVEGGNHSNVMTLRRNFARLSSETRYRKG